MAVTTTNPSSESGHGHGGGHSGGSTGESSGGHGHGNPAMAAFFAQRQMVVEKMMMYFAAGICGLIAIFVILHWTRWLCARLERSKKPLGVLGRPFVATSRFVRNLLVRRLPGFKSAGHGLLVFGYVAINAVVAFSNVDISLPNFAARFGWMAEANISLAVFLALKNTPLACITAYSYERLNCLHQIVGYTIFVFMVLHAAFYTSYFSSQGRLLSIYSQRGQIAAIVAGFAFLSVTLSATFVRRIWYELFYITHISGWVIGIVAVGFHQPHLAEKALIVTLLTSSMWCLDRLIRASKLLYYRQEATLHPLPDGGTKIVMRKAPAGAEPGKHCFVWIPAVRRFETHPFTIHHGSPVEFTVKAENGFTRDLHKYAVAHPGAAVRASVDGPYGTFPDPMEFDKIVLIAGGGGATFTFGLAANLLERMNDESRKCLVFVWAVRAHENLFWFRKQLEMLRTHAHSAKANVSIYVTRAPPTIPELPYGHGQNDNGSSSSSEDGGSPPLSPVDAEKHSARLPAAASRGWGALSEKDLEKEMERAIETRIELADTSNKRNSKSNIMSSQVYSSHPVKIGRPDVASLIRDAVATTPQDQRVLVAACGPKAMMRDVRNTTARLIVGDGPAIELHCEEFGW